MFLLHFPGKSALLLLGLLIAPTVWTAGADSEARGYETLRDIPYRKGADIPGSPAAPCRLDLCYPAGAKDFSTVVWIHGGGLTEGSRSFPDGLMRKGFAVASIDYRLSPTVKSPAYVEDAAAAVAWVFQNIEKYGGSPDRIFVTGHSAGGYLAMMLGLDKKYLAAHGIDADRIAGLMPLSGQAITHFTVRKERGMSEKQPLIDEMAPLYHVRADAPPMLLITGDRELELLGRYEENAYLWRMLKLAGHKDVELHELKGLDHGGMVAPSFDLLIPFVSTRTKAPATR